MEVDGSVVTWSYDSAYQLTNEERIGSNGYNITYAYDGVGNRTLLISNGSPTTYIYGATNELATSQSSSGVTTYVFDGGGNLFTSLAPGNQLTTNAWDGENRLTHVSLPAGIVDTFTYNSDGHRVQKQDSTGTTNHIWDGENILLESDGSGSIQVVYTLTPSLAGELVSQSRSGQTAYYHFDGYDSTREISNTSAVITDSYVYNSFGEIIASSGTTATPFRYLGGIGYYLDNDTQRLYVRNRFLETALGRWQSQDPLGVRFADVNTFLYVTNNPLRFTDRLGLQPQVAKCDTELNAILSDPAFMGNLNIAHALRCNVDFFCSNGCGAGGAGGPAGNTFVANGRVHVCIDANQMNLDSPDPPDILVAILLHETVHVVQLLLAFSKLCCGAPMQGPPPPVPNLGGLSCDQCKNFEKAAYEVSCKYLYGNDRDPKLAISRCVDIGLCFSCLHVCRTTNKSEFPGRPVQAGPPNLPVGGWRKIGTKLGCQQQFHVPKGSDLDPFPPVLLKPDSK